VIRPAPAEVIDALTRVSAPFNVSPFFSPSWSLGMIMADPPLVVYADMGEINIKSPCRFASSWIFPVAAGLMLCSWRKMAEIGRKSVSDLILEKRRLRSCGSLRPFKFQLMKRGPGFGSIPSSVRSLTHTDIRASGATFGSTMSSSLKRVCDGLRGGCFLRGSKDRSRSRIPRARWRRAVRPLPTSGPWRVGCRPPGMRSRSPMTIVPSRG
jgi:hypothetical protein